ncbi:MAG: hypothetical protein L0228_13860 [Planctomycetes bacterium]|nr:hypothetical protein [Planctomycetota bacterium]
MVEQPAKIREVVWSELFPWLMLVRAVRIALMARVMILGAVGILATMLGWWLLAEVFSRSTDPVITSWRDVTNLNLWTNQETWIDISTRSAPEVIYSATQYLFQAPIAIWQFMTAPFMGLFHGDLSATGFFFLLLCGIWELLVWGLVGGAITRIAALKFTRDEASGPIAALKHAARKLPSYSLPPLVALLWAAVFAVPLALIGWAMQLDFLALLAGIFWPFVILLGLLMAILLLGLLVGWPMMWATVSVEGTDAFDALSRSFAYTYHRPFRLLWYVLFAALLAVISMFVVKLFAASAIALGDWSIDWGLDAETMEAVVTPPAEDGSTMAPLAPPAGTEVAPVEGPALNADDATPAGEPRELGAMLSGARRSIHFWKMMVAALAAGYQAGFLWVSAVGVYLLMRCDIDGVQLNEVYVDPADEYGMPPLADEATSGVPEVSPGAPALPGNTGPA